MRLLKAESNGELSLTEDLLSNIPPYAILSHTWGPDSEEVSFSDFTHGTGKSKLGYNKLRFCAKQAALDGLGHFWVDTCCIDKSNSVELQEAINSMFRWYKEARKCYVYLPDVSPDKASGMWESCFRQSRWFTRGWTLQELLAPAVVEFFCEDGTRLGNRVSMEQLIHEVTRISLDALRGKPLNEFSVDQRMSWAETRQTKRGEDKAYSLLGIFGIFMPLIYGEGESSAMKRLREEIDKNMGSHEEGLIGSLSFATGAPFNAYSRQNEPTCLPDTRVELLRDIHLWLGAETEQHIFWLNGLAGTGKSTISRTIARSLSEDKTLGASFFFSRGGGDVSHSGKFVTSIAVQLAASIPSMRQLINKVLGEQKGLETRSISDQWHHLVLEPLSNLGMSNQLRRYTLVIDALDECDNEDDIGLILILLAKLRSSNSFQLRVFLTSRPEIPIRHGFQQIPEKHKDFVLHNISPSIIDHDIGVFFRVSLQFIQQERSLPSSWPGDETIEHLVKSTSGLFIWAATACRFIRQGRRHAARRLNTILENDGTMVSESGPEGHLDKIYTQVLMESIPPEFTEEEKEEAFEMLRLVLGSLVTLHMPLSAVSLSGLLDLPQEDLVQTIEDLHSILNIDENKNIPIRLHHPSFRDFLLNKTRCQEPSLFVESKDAHRVLFEGCLQLMSKLLKQNICEAPKPGTLATEIRPSQIDGYIPLQLQYACRYWLQHLRKSDLEISNNDQLHVFLKEHFLHWIEALGWMKLVSESVYMVIELESLVVTNSHSGIAPLIRDMKSFILYSRAVVKEAPLQIYCSSLVFAPNESLVRQQFKNCIPPWIRALPKVRDHWDASLQTIESRYKSHSTITFSPDGRKLAAGYENGCVSICDVVSGAELHLLKGHDRKIRAIAFSPDGKFLATLDGGVSLWDTASMTQLQKFDRKDICDLFCLAFSLDSKTLAVGGEYGVSMLWDVAPWKRQKSLRIDLDTIHFILFSFDGSKMVSLRKDGAFTVWDLASGEPSNQHPHRAVRIMTAALTEQDTLFLISVCICTDTAKLEIQDILSGRQLNEIEYYPYPPEAVAFSSNGRLLASIEETQTIQLFNTNSKEIQSTLGRHTVADIRSSLTEEISSLAISPDEKIVASSRSIDNTVKLWHVDHGTKPTASEHMESSPIRRLSQNGRVFISYEDEAQLDSTDSSASPSLKVVDTASGELVLNYRGVPILHDTINFSMDGSIMLFARKNGYLEVWRTKSWEQLHVFQFSNLQRQGLSISPNGKLLTVSIPKSDYLQLFDIERGALLYTFDSPLGDPRWFGHLARPVILFSPQSTILAILSVDRALTLYSTKIYQKILMKELPYRSVDFMAFSPDESILITKHQDNIETWDIETGTREKGISSYGTIDAMAMSFDNTRLAAASRGGLIMLWDLSTLINPMSIESGFSTTSLSFTADGAAVQNDRGFKYSVKNKDGELVFVEGSPALCMENSWVCVNGEKLLWIPPDYRTTRMEVYDNNFVLAYESGEFVRLEISYNRR